MPRSTSEIQLGVLHSAASCGIAGESSGCAESVSRRLDDARTARAVEQQNAAAVVQPLRSVPAGTSGALCGPTH